MVILVFALFIIAIVTIFSVQNASPVAVSFLFWNFQASLAIVIFLSTLIGVIIGAIVFSVVRRTVSSKKVTKGVTR
ncbi:MAG TPA: LapA family protein [Thermodesulfovibrionales bacterium]|nr:LapA family protein [Thermodesulfovibrionales bacterium]